MNSDLTDARSITTLAFGGNAGLPQQSLTKSLDLSNELSWLEGNGDHRIKLGALFSGSRFTQDATSNRLGTYTFNSLEDLADNQPSIFTRTLSPRIRSGTSLNSALYLGDTWRKSRSLQLTYGARLEHTQFDGAPRTTLTSNRSSATGRTRSDGNAREPAGGIHMGLGRRRSGRRIWRRRVWWVRRRRGGRGGAGGGGGGDNAARPNANASASVPLVLRGGIGEFRARFPRRSTRGRRTRRDSPSRNRSSIASARSCPRRTGASGRVTTPASRRPAPAGRSTRRPLPRVRTSPSSTEALARRGRGARR